MRSAGAILVHTAAERDALMQLTDRPVAVAALPPHLPAGVPLIRPPDRPPTRRLLFFGKVRLYKGVDILLEAVTHVPDVELSIVGEFYEELSELHALVDRLGLTDRVRIRPEYLPAEQIPEMFAEVDALVLPYRTATASQLVALAHWHGLPTVVTRVGNFPDVVSDGVDGLLCTPDDADDLVRALRELYEPGRLAALRAAVRPPESEQVWADYLATLAALAGAPELAGLVGDGRALQSHE